MLRFNFSRFAALVGLAAVFSSCTKSVVVEEGGVKSHVTVDVRTFDLASVGFRASGSSSDVVTKGGDSDSPASRLSFAVFDAEGALVGEVINKVSSANGFGLVEMDLYPGVYSLVAVAHGGASDAVIASSSSVVLPGTRLTDTFAKVQSLTVVSGEDCNLGMTLPRVTSAFVLRLVDTPPSSSDEIEVVLNTAGLAPSSLGFDPSSGLASNNWKLSCRLLAEDFASGDVPVYFMSMFPVSVINVKATAYDSDGEEIISHTIKGVTMTPNKKTIATGRFFVSQGSGSFTLASTWDSDNNISY